MPVYPSRVPVTKTSSAAVIPDDQLGGCIFKGLIGDMQVYNYVLSADEIATLYAGSNGPYCRNEKHRERGPQR